MFDIRGVVAPVLTALLSLACYGQRPAAAAAQAAVPEASVQIQGESPPSSKPSRPFLERSFADWKAACARLPANRALRGRWPPRDLLPLSRFQDFDEVLEPFFAQCKTGQIAQAEHWVGEAPASKSFFNTALAYFEKPGRGAQSPAIPFAPFAQKSVLPEGSEVFFHADLHGDIRSLLEDVTWLNQRGYLQDFSISRTNFYMVYLGDYTDRGAYGVEVLYTLLRLKLANPTQVFLLRGNHEEVSLQTRYGFLDEGRAKYGAEFDAKRVLRAYDFLPVVLYLGCGENFIQCNHGGLEPGFSPRSILEDSAACCFQFLGPLNQRQYLATHPGWFSRADAASSELAAEAFHDFRPADPLSPFPIGFMWNDFSVFATEPQFDIVPDRGFAYGPRATRLLLDSAGTTTKHLQAVFRGHQHSGALNPMMRRLIASRGVFRHWQTEDSPTLLKAGVKELSSLLDHSPERAVPIGSVWTFNVAPDSVYGEGCGYSFDSFGILKMAGNFADWRLKVVNVPVEP